MAEDFDRLVRHARDLLGAGVRRVRLQDGERVVEVEADPAALTVVAAARATPNVAPALTAAPELDGRVAVEAPLVGTFYRSPQPGAAPFVEEGDVVAADQTVAIIEAMKIMNTIAAQVAGRVVAIVAVDGDIVEFGQPLLYLEPE